MAEIQIIFEDGDIHYYPGSTVRGSAVITVDKPVDCKNVTVQLFGRANVRWTETRSTGNQTHTVTYSNLVTYIKEKTVVWSKEAASFNELSIGEYTYPFEYQLPHDIPHSFESYFGQVRYEVKAKVKMSALLKKNPKTIAVIDVRENTSLSMCREPVSTDMTKNVKCCCFNFGSVNVRSNLPQSGYSPGDTIPININIENNTTKTIRIRASLYKLQVFTASRGRQKVQQSNESVLMSPEIPAGVITSFDGSSITVPDNAPTTLRSCSCISVEYFVVFTAVAALGSSMKMMVPIVIDYS